MSRLAARTVRQALGDGVWGWGRGEKAVERAGSTALGLNGPLVGWLYCGAIVGVWWSYRWPEGVMVIGLGCIGKGLRSGLGSFVDRGNDSGLDAVAAISWVLSWRHEGG